VIKVDKRAYFEKLGKLVTNKDISVLFSNHVTACDVARNKIIIPTVDSIQVVSDPLEKFWVQRMSFYHECGHTMFTRKNQEFKDQLHKDVINFFEDLRIETKLSQLFPALKQKFALSNKLALKSIDRTRIDQTARKMVNAARAFYGLDSSKLLDEVEKEILEAMRELEQKPTAKRCLELSDKVYELLKNRNNQNDQDSQNSQNSQKNENENENENKNENTESNDSQNENENENENKNKNKNENKNENTSDQGSDENSENIESDVESELQNEIQELQREIQELGIDVGKSDSEVVFKEVEKERLIKESIVSKIVKVLAQAKGSRKSYNMELREAGENINIDALIQARHDQNHIDFYDDYKRDRMNIKIILALDVSGSMQGEPLKIAKRALANFSEACERVGIKTHIIAFCDYPSDLKEFDEKTASSRIDYCYASGGTSIPRAIDHMVEIAKQNGRCLGIVISDLNDWYYPVNLSIAKAKKYLRLWAIQMKGNWTDPFEIAQQNWERIFKINNINELGYALEKLANVFIRNF
jgi:Mg-chelatase subunit ChlD